MNKHYFEILTITVIPFSPKTNVNVFNRKIKYRKEKNRSELLLPSTRQSRCGS